MHPRTLVTALRRRPRSDRRPPAAVRRPAIYLGVAASGALVVNLVVGTGPAAQAGAAGTESVSVARQLGLEEVPEAADVTRDLGSLSDLAASRSSREDARAAAQFAQAAADQAVIDRQRAEAEAAARKAAEEAAARQAAERAAAQAAAAAAKAAAPRTAPAPSAKAPAAGLAEAARSVAATVRARISNTAGAINPRAQAAADAVVSNVPGAASITLGGTRASAADPGGHPSGLAVDYMVMSNGALGDAIVAYHVANWNALGVDYIIWKQRMLSSPGGSWKQMENRGSATANHMDHPHVNYR
ncbi:hypothetical protein SAMN05660662_0486 [Blastococcus aurantiacus]|uniref:ARB-07466-like C-terminal domain-containing protein n=1 Tax=Blastococcus aurantiacus TaxID=1550231 RepID=A0A1G7HBS1_9ACTN|nr:hypothetical protein [Blastococcus aurantiacus]SDE97559.1 hypothetical protein SAMN05660662_0486 [Blastococcus aurantiacus]